MVHTRTGVGTLDREPGMDEETREALVETLRSVKRTKKTHHFWMISKAEDGEPLLMVHKKAAILARDARAARKTAKVKIPATGPLLWFCAWARPRTSSPRR